MASPIASRDNVPANPGRCEPCNHEELAQGRHPFGQRLDAVFRGRAVCQFPAAAVPCTPLLSPDPNVPTGAALRAPNPTQNSTRSGSANPPCEAPKAQSFGDRLKSAFGSLPLNLIGHNI